MTKEIFENILEICCKKLTEESQKEKFKSSKQFEDRVREILKDLLDDENFKIESNTPAQAFPDIPIGEYGVEVKFTANDTWRSIGNSILETQRVESVKFIYIIYGKMGGIPEVKWSDYESSIIHVRTSHVPRFEVEIFPDKNSAKESLFKQFGISYDEFRKLDMSEKMKYIRAYARKIHPDEKLWWIEENNSEKNNFHKKSCDELKIDLAKPHSLSIANIINLLRKHFTFKYSGSGASRLPTLAIYAAYQCMMNQVARYEEKILCPLESHTSADFQSGRIGDIEIKNSDGTAFEGVEIKHEITITRQIISDAYEKFKIYNTDRYYILTTAEKNFENISEIEEEILRIEKIHGCQVIVNGVYDTLKYYLRLLKDTSEFISNYVELLKIDDSIKFLHKKKWNDFVAENI